MSDRGMKKWAPYRSLIEQLPSLDEARFEKEKISKPVLAEDKIEEINGILVNYHGQEIKITFFRDDKLIEIVSTIKKIDIYEKKLVLLDSKSIKLDEIIDIEDFN